MDRSYWFTTHHPHSQGHPWHLFMKDEFVTKARDVRIGDEIIFYETSSGGGMGGIVVLGRVSGNRRPNQNPGGVVDDDGRPLFAWEWPCEPIEVNGFASWPRIRDTLGLFVPLIPGGLKKLSQDQHKTLVSLFRSGAR